MRTNTIAEGVNDRGEIVGSYSYLGDRPIGFLMHHD